MSRPHLPTLLAVALVAWPLAKIVHEGLGHGLSCVIGGGQLIGISSSWCDCEDLPAAALRLEKAAGTLLNLAFAMGAFAWLKIRPPARPASRYFLWLTLTVQGFMGGGYLLTDPIFGFGDWTAFLEGLPGQDFVRVLLVMAGAMISMVMLGLGLQQLRPFLPAEMAARRRLSRLFCILPWAVVGGGVMTLAAAFNHYGLSFAGSSALATIGGGAFLAWLPTWVERVRIPEGHAPIALVADGLWMGLGGLSLVFLFASLGPGIFFAG